MKQSIQVTNKNIHYYKINVRAFGQLLGVQLQQKWPATHAIYRQRCIFVNERWFSSLFNTSVVYFLEHSWRCIFVNERVYVLRRTCESLVNLCLTGVPFYPGYRTSGVVSESLGTHFVPQVKFRVHPQGWGTRWNPCMQVKVGGGVFKYSMYILQSSWLEMTKIRIPFCLRPS